MELSHQVTSIELSKQLKELGVKQESLFQWIEEFDNEFKIYPSSPHFPHPDWRDINTIDDYSCSAFTASELLEILPHCIEKNNIQYGLTIDKGYKTYYAIYDTHTMDGDWDRNEILIENDSNDLSNVLSKLLINIITHKLIEV